MRIIFKIDLREMDFKDVNLIELVPMPGFSVEAMNFALHKNEEYLDIMSTLPTKQMIPRSAS
jgi:hypothetical protein